jgi:hypothetical protein
LPKFIFLPLHIHKLSRPESIGGISLRWRPEEGTAKSPAATFGFAAADILQLFFTGLVLLAHKKEGLAMYASAKNCFPD